MASRCSPTSPAVANWRCGTGRAARSGSRYTLTTPRGGRAVAFSPDGRQFTSVPEAWWPEEVWVYEAASGHVRRKISGHRGDVTVLGFTPDGTKLLTAGGDHTVLVWDVRPQSMTLPESV